MILWGITQMFVSTVCLEEASEDCPGISAVQREKKLLDGMIQNLLPTVGPSVRSLSLAYSSAVSSKMVSIRSNVKRCKNCLLW